MKKKLSLNSASTKMYFTLLVDYSVFATEVLTEKFKKLFLTISHFPGILLGLRKLNILEKNSEHVRPKKLWFPWDRGGEILMQHKSMYIQWSVFVLFARLLFIPDIELLFSLLYRISWYLFSCVHGLMGWA